MKIAQGKQENGIFIGNTYDKYGTNNIIVRKIMANFERTIDSMVAYCSPSTIYEVGCGEGYWVIRWSNMGIQARGSDFSLEIIKTAQLNARDYDLPSSLFSTKSIYDISPDTDSADLVVCCEVLEHLQDPRKALERLKACSKPNSYLLLSVPREPIWSFLNLARFKYIKNMGNTPGHIQRWSRRGFLNLVCQYFEVVRISTPLPWTVVLCKA